MPTPEQPAPESSPRTNIAEAFRALPLAEQLTALPDILNTALASDKREKVIHYLETLLAEVVPEHSPFHVSRARVLAIGAYTAEELASFTDDDFEDIAERIEDHFRQDWINAEIVFHVQEMLEAKRASQSK
jgi:hypothetical protein